MLVLLILLVMLGVVLLLLPLRLLIWPLHGRGARGLTVLKSRTGPGGVVHLREMLLQVLLTLRNQDQGISSMGRAGR